MKPPSGTTLGDTHISHREVHERFSETDDGNTLREQIRFRWYKPDSMSHDEWKKLIGPDVCNLDHLWETHRLTRGFIRATVQADPSALSMQQQHHLTRVAVSHDWGEAIHNDKKADLKTDVDDAVEMETLVNESVMWLHQMHPELIPTFRASIHQVLQKGDPHLYIYFNSIERFGYMRSGLRAFQHSREPRTEEARDKLEMMAANVIGNNLVILIERSRACPALKRFLQNRGALISEALLGIADNQFIKEQRYGIEQAKGIDENLARARDVWFQEQLTIV